MDCTGRIYAPGEDGVTCFDAAGEIVFAVMLPHGKLRAMAPVAAGELAIVSGDELFLVR